MSVFGSLDRNAKAFAEFAEWLRRPLRALQVASATLCALLLLACNSLKFCGSAFRNELAKVEIGNNIAVDLNLLFRMALPSPQGEG